MSTFTDRTLVVSGGSRGSYDGGGDPILDIFIDEP